MNTQQQGNFTKKTDGYIYFLKNSVAVQFSADGHIQFPFVCGHCHHDLKRQCMTDGSFAYICPNCSNTVSQTDIEGIMRIFPKIS